MLFVSAHSKTELHSNDGSSTGPIILATGNSEETGHVLLNTAESILPNSIHIAVGSSFSRSSSAQVTVGSAKLAGDMGLLSGLGTSGGELIIMTHSVQGATRSGNIEVSTGKSTEGKSGKIKFSVSRPATKSSKSGEFMAVAGKTGTIGGGIRLKAGRSSTNQGGSLSIISGESTILSSGIVLFKSTDTTNDGISGNFQVFTGVSGEKKAGNLTIKSGKSASGESGNIGFKVFQSLKSGGGASFSSGN
jgi:hypothetical protein